MAMRSRSTVRGLALAKLAALDDMRDCITGFQQDLDAEVMPGEDY